MSYTYANRKRRENAAPNKESAAQQPSMDALRAGLAKPTQEQMGRRVDLPDAMRSKMENAFGADLSAVKLYESEAVADAGANAITQGSNIAFAPGMLDFTSYGGQALLGHELSHVVSQQRGEVRGGGFLNDHALEARADREGAMAAAGQQIAAPTAALSTASAAPAAGPMQADKKADKAAKREKSAADAQRLRTVFSNMNLYQNDPRSADEYNAALSEFDSIARGASKDTGKMIAEASRRTGEGFMSRVNAQKAHGMPQESAFNAAASSPYGRSYLNQLNFERAFKARRRGKEYIPLSSIPE